MPITIPATQFANGQPLTFGGGTVCNNGYLFVENGAVDITLEYGSSPDMAESIAFPNTSAGQYYFTGGTTTGIVGLQIRPAAGVLSAPAQAIQGAFTEPALPSLSPVGGGITLSPVTGAIYAGVTQNPTGTASGTFVHCGLGSATFGGASISPVKSGIVYVTASGYASDNVANDGIDIRLVFGTGTAPNNGAIQTGTLFGSLNKPIGNPSATQVVPFTLAAFVPGTLSVGGTNWLDLVQASAGGGGTVTLLSVVMSAFEL